MLPRSSARCSAGPLTSVRAACTAKVELATGGGTLVVLVVLVVAVDSAALLLPPPLDARAKMTPARSATITPATISTRRRDQGPDPRVPLAGPTCPPSAVSSGRTDEATTSWIAFRRDQTDRWSDPIKQARLFGLPDVGQDSTLRCCREKRSDGGVEDSRVELVEELIEHIKRDAAVRSTPFVPSLDLEYRERPRSKECADLIVRATARDDHPTKRRVRSLVRPRERAGASGLDWQGQAGHNHQFGGFEIIRRGKTLQRFTRALPRDLKVLLSGDGAARCSVEHRVAAAAKQVFTERRAVDVQAITLDGRLRAYLQHGRQSSPGPPMKRSRGGAD